MFLVNLLLLIWSTAIFKKIFYVSNTECKIALISTKMLITLSSLKQPFLKGIPGYCTKFHIPKMIKVSLESIDFKPRWLSLLLSLIHYMVGVSKNVTQSHQILTWKHWQTIWKALRLRILTHSMSHCYECWCHHLPLWIQMLETTGISIMCKFHTWNFLFFSKRQRRHRVCKHKVYIFKPPPDQCITQTHSVCVLVLILSESDSSQFKGGQISLIPLTCTSNRFHSKTKGAARSPLPTHSKLHSSSVSITLWMQMGLEAVRNIKTYLLSVKVQLHTWLSEPLGRFDSS